MSGSIVASKSSSKQARRGADQRLDKQPRAAQASISCVDQRRHVAASISGVERQRREVMASRLERRIASVGGRVEWRDGAAAAHRAAAHRSGALVTVRHLKESSYRYSTSRRVASRRAAKRDRGRRARQPEPKLFRGWGDSGAKTKTCEALSSLSPIGYEDTNGADADRALPRVLSTLPLVAGSEIRPTSRCASLDLEKAGNALVGGNFCGWPTEAHPCGCR